MTFLLEAEGPISRGYWKLAALIASCPQWWFTICARENPVAAMDRIHWPTASDTAIDEATGGEIELPASARPRAIISDSPICTFTEDGNGNPALEMGLLLSIEIPAFQEYTFFAANFWPTDFWPADFWPSYELSEKNQKLALTNAIGVLLREMMARRGSDPAVGDPEDPLNTSHQNVVSIEQMQSPGLVDPSEYGGNYFGSAAYLVRWQGIV